MSAKFTSNKTIEGKVREAVVEGAERDLYHPVKFGELLADVKKIAGVKEEKDESTD